MRFKKLIYTTALCITVGTLGVHAQDKKATEKKEEETNKDVKIAEEIEVVRPYKPILAEAVKLRRSPDLNDVKSYKAKFNYGLTDRKLELNSDINKLQAQKVAEDRPEELTNNYLKGALGTSGNILGEAYLNIGRDEALQAGGFFRHFSQEGKLNGQKFNQQELGVFGKSIADQFSLTGRINYQRNGTYFYGQDLNNNSFLNDNPEKQAFNFLEAEGEIASKYTPDEDAFSYAAKINGYVWSDKFNAKENAVVLAGYMNKRISTFNMGLAASVEMGKTQDVSSINNNVFRLNPYLRLQANGVKINAGINFVQEFGSLSKSRIFPAVTADFTLIPDYLQIFGELKGDVNRTSLKQLTDENPYLNSNIEIQNTVEKISFAGGIKGTGGPGFGYKAKVYHKELEQLPLFVNSFDSPNKFDVIYDFGKTKLLGLEGEVSIQVSNNLHWTGRVNLENYKPSAERESWYKPQLRITSNLLYNVNDKLGFNAAVAIQGDSKAKLYTAQPASPYVLPDPATETFVTVKGFVDLGFGASYKINKQFSVFARANNLLNNKNGRFLYYQAIGVNGFGGVTYSF